MKTFLRRTLLGLCGLLILLALFHLEENWRGSRAWATWQREQEAAGFNFDRASYAPPAIPDDENFAAAPQISAAIDGTQDLLKLPANWPTKWPIQGHWQDGQMADIDAFRPAFKDGDLGKGLEGYRSFLDNLEKAAQRPGCRLKVDYAHFPDGGIPSLLGFRAAARMLQLRALVSLREGRTEAAFRDVSTLLRMVDHFGKQPVLLSELLQLALTGIALQPIWEGFERHAWSDAQLASLQAMLAKEDFLVSMNRALIFETAGLSAYAVRLAGQAPWSRDPLPDFYAYSEGPVPPSKATIFLRRLVYPRGWVLQGAVRSHRMLKEILPDSCDVRGRTIDPRRQDAALQAHSKPGHGPYSIFIADTAPAMVGQYVRAARFQSALLQASLACDLERYHRAKGAYPEQLSALGTPVPPDVIQGHPIHYRRTSEGGYLLYSVGWNGTDEGGQPGQGENATREGDWVWRIHGGPASPAKKR